MSGSLHQSNMQYYVALDLGSESMAACYIGDSPDPKILDLQQFAKAYIEKKNEDSNGSPIDHRRALLYDSDDDYASATASARMKTRIVLRSPNPYRELNAEHAKIEFIDEMGHVTDDYRRSIFNFFPGPFEELSFQLPNPKVPFQAGADYILPTVLCREGDAPPVEVRYSPESLVQNLLNQIVRNFVLQSKELRAIPKENINLAVTVPNVYSLTHVKSIEQFLKQHSGLKPQNVHLIYESDAVCHYHHLFDRILRKIKQEVIEVQQADKKRDELRYHFATVDIGSGTTDMSLVTVRQGFQRMGSKAPVFQGRTSHLVSGRVGRSDGGNKLSFIFADFYDQRLQSVLLDFRPSSPEIRTEFSFKKRLGRFAEQHSQALASLTELIFKIKSSMSENYQIRVTPTAQIRMLVPVVEAIFECLLLDWRYRRDLQGDFDELAHRLLRAMVLPPDLNQGLINGYKFYLNVSRLVREIDIRERLNGEHRNDPLSDLDGDHSDIPDEEDYSKLPEEVVISPSGEKMVTKTHVQSAASVQSEPVLVTSGNGSQPVNSRHARSDLVPAASRKLNALNLWREYKALSRNWRALRRTLLQYVKNNISDLLEDLHNMSVLRERGSERDHASNKIVNPHFTYVMVAGQGSQFKPIMRAIQNSRFARNGNIVSLPVADLKNACCKGAAQLIANRIEIENPYELHGSYYLYQRLVTINTQPVPLRLNLETELKPNLPGLKWLVFSPSSRPPELKEEGGQEDGRLAFICQIADESSYRFYYDTRQQIIRINDVIVDKLATFGHIDEAIWPKVWPVVLPSERSHTQ